MVGVVYEDVTYRARGAMAALWQGHEGGPEALRIGREYDQGEVLIVGPANTGKTFGVCQWFHWLLSQGPPNLRVLFVRATLQSLRESVQQKFEDEVLRQDGILGPRVLQGPKRDYRRKYVYPQGAEINLAGLDHPERLYSTQCDVVWLEEGIEAGRLELARFHRMLRNKALGWHLILITTNPKGKHHHLNKAFPAGRRTLPRTPAGSRLRLLSQHEDNPRITPHELRSLRDMPEPLRSQLYLGEWVSAEGLIWPEFSEQTHVLGVAHKLKRDPGGAWHIDQGHGLGDPIRLKWFIASMDFGTRAPGCFQVWGFDELRRGFCVAEVYRREWRVAQWADAIKELSSRYGVRAIFADCAEPRTIEILNTELGYGHGRGLGQIVVPCDKSRGKQHGLAVVRNALASDRLFWLDEKQRLYQGPDEELVKEGKPYDTPSEIPEYIYLSLEKARTEEERDRIAKREQSDPRCAEHGCDALEYMATWAWGVDRLELEPPPAPATPSASAPKHVPGMMLEASESIPKRRRK